MEDHFEFDDNSSFSEEEEMPPTSMEQDMTPGETQHVNPKHLMREAGASQVHGNRHTKEEENVIR